MSGGMMNLLFPMLGLDRSGSYQQQAPHTTMDCMNVRPIGAQERRFRGGTRGGLDRVYHWDDGDVNAPVQFINTVAFANAKGWDSWQDDFDADNEILGTSWDSTPGWGSGWDTPTVRDGRVEVAHPDVLGAVLVTGYDLGLYNQFVAGQEFVFRIWIAPYEGRHWGSYRLWFGMDATTPDLTDSGTQVELVLGHSGSETTVSGSIKEWGTGTAGPTTTAFTAQSNQHPASGWLEAHFVPGDGDAVFPVLNCYWRGVLLKTTSLLVMSPDGVRIGFGMEPASSGGVCRVEHLQIHYLHASNLTTRRIVVAGRDGKVFREEYPGRFVTVGDVLSTENESVNTAEYFQHLLIADYGQPLLTNTRMIVTNDGYTVQIDDDNVPSDEWPDIDGLNIDPEKHVIEIVAQPGNEETIDGTYLIESIEEANDFDDLPAKIHLKQKAGGDGAVRVRVVVAPKRYFYGSGGDTAGTKRAAAGVLEGDSSHLLRDYNVDTWADYGVVAEEDQASITSADSPGVAIGDYLIAAVRDESVILAKTAASVLPNGLILVSEDIDATVTDLMTQEDEIASVGRDVAELTRLNSTLHDVTDNGRISADGTRMRSTSQDLSDWVDVTAASDAILLYDFPEDAERTAARLIAGLGTAEFTYWRIRQGTDLTETVAVIEGSDGIQIFTDSSETVLVLDHTDFSANLVAGTDQVVFETPDGPVIFTLAASQEWATPADPREDTLILTGFSAIPTGTTHIRIVKPDAEVIFISPPAKWPGEGFSGADVDFEPFRQCSYSINTRSAALRNGTWPIESFEEYDVVGTTAVPYVGAVASNVLTDGDVTDWTTLGIVPDIAYAKFISGNNMGDEFLVVTVEAASITLDGAPDDGGTEGYKIYYKHALRFDESVLADGQTVAVPCSVILKKPAQLYLAPPWPGGSGVVSYIIATRAEQVGHQVSIWTTSRNADGTQKGQVPSLCRLISVFQDRVFLAAPMDFPHLYFACRQGDDRDWDYSQLSQDDPSSAVAGATVFGGRLADPIVALITHVGDYLIFGCDHSMHILRGDPGLLAPLDMLTPATGIVSDRAWCHDTRGRLWFMGHDGLYAMAGSGVPEPISQTRIPDELRGLRDSTHRVQLVYDEVGFGIWIFVRARGGSERYSYWFDIVGNGFWPQDIPEQAMPTSTYGRIRDQKTAIGVILGGRDGFVRCFDRSHIRDDGVAIPWWFWNGPYRTTGEMSHEGMVLSINATLAKPGGSATWYLHGGQDCEEILRSTRFMQGTWIPGRNLQSNPRLKAGAFGVKVGGTAITEHVAFESASVRLAALARQRRTGV